MDKFRGKIFNNEVFEKYLRTVPSTKENSLINNALFTVVNKYKGLMNEQTGGWLVNEPIKGRIGGTAVNYDGNTDITSTERTNFYQKKVCFGRAKGWKEYDFTQDITGANFEAEASEIKEYYDELKQGTVLAILKGIFAMNDTAGAAFATKHTYSTTAELTAADCNKAAQKALGDKKKNLQVIYMHSAVSTALEGLNLINFLKYTDADGIERDLTIGQYNGKLVIVDDEMPVEDGYDEATSTTSGALKVIASGTPSTGEILLATVRAADFYPSAVAANDYVVAAQNYVSYMFENGFFEFEDIGATVPSELHREAKEKGGYNEIITRVRYMIVPRFISYIGTGSVSPTDANFATGTNWEIVNDDQTSKTYVDDKLIPVVRIKSRVE